MTVSGGSQTDLMLMTKTIEDASLVTFNHQLTYTAYEDVEASSGTTGQGRKMWRLSSRNTRVSVWE